LAVKSDAAGAARRRTPMLAGDGASGRRSGVKVCRTRACTEETGGGRGFRGRSGRGGRSGGAEGGRERDLGGQWELKGGAKKGACSRRVEGARVEWSKEG
jgi:hypothetical protein